MKILDLSKKEIFVFDALKNGIKTPLLISRATKVTRPAVYEIINKLHKRGLVKSKIKNGKKYWEIRDKKEIEQEIYKTKKYLLDIPASVKEADNENDSSVVIYRGAEEIEKLIVSMSNNNKNKRLFGIQGNNSEIGWSKIFSPETTNKLNRAVKENKIIMEAITPEGWLKKHTQAWGKKWAENFRGRMTVFHEINEKYFQHGGQLFATKKSIYLFSMNENIAIEINNSEIQKMILAMFYFMQDNSRKIDPNEILKNFIET